VSRIPPRTPPAERLLDRNKFVGRIDTETDRRLREVEDKAEAAKGTTITQTVSTPSTGTGTGSTPSSPTQYTAAVLAPNYPITLPSAYAVSAPHRSFVVDDSNYLGFGAGALVLAKIQTGGTTGRGVRIYSPGNLNSYTDIMGLQFEPSRLNLLPGAIVADGQMWRVGASSAWESLTNLSDYASQVGDRLWWNSRVGSSSNVTTYYMDPDFVVRTATTLANVSSGYNGMDSSFVAGTAGQFFWRVSTDSGGNTTSYSYYRPNDTTSPWTQISPADRGWSNTNACVDDEGLWYVSDTSLVLVRPNGATTYFDDLLPFAVTSSVPLVPLGSRSFFFAGYYTSGTTQYPVIANLSPLGSALLLDGDGGTNRRATSLGRAANGDVYARFYGSPSLYRITPS
jgi:hypothetical protein